MPRPLRIRSVQLVGGPADPLLGSDGRPVDVVFAEGRVAEIAPATAEPPSPGEVDGRGRWLIPGLVDLHSHLAWGAFEQAERDAQDPGERREQTLAAMQATLSSGVTIVRDAGGLSSVDLRYAAASGFPLPRVQLSQAMLGADDARGPEHLSRRVRELVAEGSTWIKAVLTGGLSASADRVLEPVLDRDEVHALIAAARAEGARVMVHAWGGPALDWAIEAGVHTIEHGIFLSEAQARAARAAGSVFVPTVEIYRATAERTDLPAHIGERARSAAAAHPLAVARALEAGLPIGAGTDFAGPGQHGTNGREVAALRAVGLDAEQSLAAATSVASTLLGTGSGRLEPGERGDAVLLGTDPALPGALATPAAAREVVLAGALVPRP